ncbi:MAG: metallophosphoesterase [Deltaproteobacteria bacterium]|nr:metallophosphoesterase [Deltaproteobacteria bacterium]
MPYAVRVTLFFLVATGLMALMHYYVWARLVRDTGLPRHLARAATLALVGLAASVLLSFITMRAFPRSVGRVICFPAYTWLGILFLLILNLLAADLLRFAGDVATRAGGTRLGPKMPERRLFIARVFGGAATVAALGASALALESGLSRPRVREIRVRLARLPRELDGTTIVQLTDMHVGPMLGPEFVADVVDRTNALKPDVIAITGDLVDGTVEQLRRAVSPIANLQAKHGVFFVTGNHEYYSGADPWIAELSRLGVRVLRNERVQVGEDASSFDLAGVDDYSARRLARGHGPDLPRALAGRDPSRELVLLAHQPRAAFEAARLGVGLQLSGHTHGGQIWPFKYIVALQQPFVAGLDRVGDMTLYTSPGTGFWGPPMRLGTRSEITKIVLESERGIG